MKPDADPMMTVSSATIGAELSAPSSLKLQRVTPELMSTARSVNPVSS